MPEMLDNQPAFLQMVSEMAEENAIGLALVAQLGSTPSEISLMFRTAILDQSVGALRPVGQYMIQIVSLVEHQLSLGLFNHFAYVDDHPLLYHHNAPSYRVFVTSVAADPDKVLAALERAYAEMFGRRRMIEEDFNERAEPQDILTAGMGLLMATPEPFAQRAIDVLKAHNVSATLLPDEPKIGHFALLAFDDSYCVGRMFTIESMRDEGSDPVLDT